MKNYYYVSEGIINQFPDLDRSTSFDGSFDKCYIAIVPDFSKIEKFYNEYEGDEIMFAYPCVDSQVSLTYDAIDYDDEDNECEVVKTLNVQVCKEWGLVTAIEQELGLTKEQNIAYVIHKLAQQAKVTPIELIELV